MHDLPISVWFTHKSVIYPQRCDLPIRGCSHMTSAKLGGWQNFPSPLIRKNQKSADPPTPLFIKSHILPISPPPWPLSVFVNNSLFFIVDNFKSWKVEELNIFMFFISYKILGDPQRKNIWKYPFLLIILGLSESTLGSPTALTLLSINIYRLSN